MTSQFADDIFLAISFLAGHAYHRIFGQSQRLTWPTFLLVTLFLFTGSVGRAALACTTCAAAAAKECGGLRVEDLWRNHRLSSSFSTLFVELRRVLFLHSFVQCSVGHSDHDWVLLIRQTFFFLSFSLYRESDLALSDCHHRRRRRCCRPQRDYLSQCLLLLLLLRLLAFFFQMARFMAIDSAVAAAAAAGQTERLSFSFLTSKKRTFSSSSFPPSALAV